MKGKTNTGVEISKTEMLAIGTEVEIVDVRHGCYTSYMCIIPSGEQIPIEAHKIDITNYTPFINWNKLRMEFAGRAMQGILSSSYDDVMNNPEEYQYVANVSIKYADALIEELKKH